MKAGDKVRLLRKFEGGAGWVGDMEYYIGKVGVVTVVDRFHPKVDFGDGYTYYYNKDVLALVKDEYEIGDEVVICQGFKTGIINGEEMNWNEGLMSKTVGMKGIITSIIGEKYYVTFPEKGDRFYYPYFCLAIEWDGVEAGEKEEEKLPPGKKMKVAKKVVIDNTIGKWIPYMDKAIGKVGVVSRELENTVLLDIKGMESFWYPRESLEEVPEEKPKKAKKKKEEPVQIDQDLLAQQAKEEAVPPVAAERKKEEAAKPVDRIRANDMVEVYRESRWKGWNDDLRKLIGTHQRVRVVIPAEGKKVARVRLFDDNVIPLAACRLIKGDEW